MPGLVRAQRDALPEQRGNCHNSPKERMFQSGRRVSRTLPRHRPQGSTALMLTDPWSSVSGAVHPTANIQRLWAQILVLRPEGAQDTIPRALAATGRRSPSFLHLPEDSLPGDSVATDALLGSLTQEGWRVSQGAEGTSVTCHSLTLPPVLPRGPPPSSLAL